MPIYSRTCARAFDLANLPLDVHVRLRVGHRMEETGAIRNASISGAFNHHGRVRFDEFCAWVIR
jgi:hypothetical protein